MNEKSIEEVGILNVHLSIKRIRKESLILAEMEEDGEIEIIGAVYNVRDGKVKFFDNLLDPKK